MGVGARFSNVKKFLRGNVIVREGDASSREMFLLLQGNIGVYRNYQMAGEAQVRVLGQGDFHGEMALFLGRIPAYTLVALTDAVVFAVGRKTLAEFLSSQPDMAFSVIEGICRRLDEAEGELTKYRLKDAPQTASRRSDLFPEGHGSYVLELNNGNTDLLYPQRLVCPLCSHSFEHLTLIASRLRAERTDKDLRVRYRDIEPLHYEIATCPGCLLSASLEQFPEISKRWAGEIAQAVGPFRLGLEIKSGIGRDTFTVFAGFYLAILCAAICFDDHQMVTAGLWHKLGRLYQDCGDSAMYLHASQKSLEDYLYAYERFRIGEKQTQQLCYVVGDLYMRLDDIDRAREFFFLAKSSKAGTNVLRRQADQRLDEIRELKQARQGQA